MVTLPVDFASSSKFCEDDQIKQSGLSTGVPEGADVPEGFFGYTGKAIVPTMLDPTFTKVVGKYNNKWGYSCHVMTPSVHLAKEVAKARNGSTSSLNK